MTQEAHGRSIALMQFLAKVARNLGVAEHVYVVGGAVRNFILGQLIKDIDIVVDSVTLGEGKDSAWFATKVAKAIQARTNLTTNQYGVAILTISEPWEVGGFEMKGEVIEFANARKESYGGADGKGYKPHMVAPATIQEDLVRREFTFNTLLWRLGDLEQGPNNAVILDLLGSGRRDLEERILRTPANPDKTFSDDPTRMLRAVKFVSKYGFQIASEVEASIQTNAPKLKEMPWDAVRKILTDDILEGPHPRRSVRLLKFLGLSEVLREMLQEEPGFAAALARTLPDKEIHLVLDLVDLGWGMKTPVGFLTPAEMGTLRAVLLQHAEELNFERCFVGALLKPPVDQMRLFELFSVPPKERGRVTQVARRLLLQTPRLALDPGHLEASVEQVLRDQAGGDTQKER